MRRAQFFLVLVAVGLIFSLFMILAPQGFASANGLAGGPESGMVFQALGAVILAVTLANFLVRNHDDSPTLAAILWMNLAIHVLAPAVDLWGAGQGVIAFAKVIPGLVIHLALAYGCYHYATRIRTT